jgi:hypothetical protein
MKRYIERFLAVGLIGIAACQDLDVMDENSPDTERALREPAAVESVIASQFLTWYNAFDITDMWAFYPVYADEMTQTWTQRGLQPSLEPRTQIRNEPLATAEMWIQRSLWDDWNAAVGNINDALKRIDSGVKIMTLDPGATEVTDNTVRAYAFAKFMQGTALGYVALSQDRAAPATEDTELPTSFEELIAWERENLRPYDEVMDVAIASLNEAIQIIDSNPAFSVPTTWVRGQALTSAQLRQVINTMAARLLVYNARTPQEREQVDWAKVLQYTANGLTFDFGPTWASGELTSTFHDRLQGTTRMRADYRLIGPSDVSGNYQRWLDTPLAQRQPFNITTPDRRITNAAGTGSGAYFRFRTNNDGFDTSRGLAYFSNYQWFRYNGSSTTVKHLLLTADENRLLRAEAMLRTGNIGEAVNLINVSRTRAVRVGTTGTATTPGLPAVTATGVPASTTCVPRTDTGACGSLMDALRYERQIELAGTDPVRAWMDYRGFGQLLDGTAVHMPIPARYLVSLQVPLYTFGGPGGQGAAVCAIDCPVAN